MDKLAPFPEERNRVGDNLSIYRTSYLIYRPPSKGAFLLAIIYKK